MKINNQMFKNACGFLLIAISSLFFSCGHSDDDAPGDTIGLSSENKIESFTIKNDISGVIDHGALTVDAQVPYGTDITSITPVVVVSENATYTPAGAQDFSSPVTYTVTSEDGWEVEYIVTITPATNAEAALLTFIFKAEDNAFEEDIEAVIDQENQAVTAQVPFGTDIAALTATITTSEGATTNVDELDFSSETILTVTAENGSTSTDYSVNISEASNPAKTEERDVLIAIYKANETNTLSWPIEDETSNIADWEGVTVNAQGSVILLNLQGKNIAILPESIGKLTALTELVLNSNQLQYLPESLGQLKELTFLNLASNYLFELPESIGNLTALTDLRLYTNQLRNLPESIGNLTQLEELYVATNRLQALPEKLGDLKQLRTLDISNNGVEILPNTIGNLAALNFLGIDNNQLVSLPASIGNLSSLTGLIAINNQLESLPDNIVNLTGLIRIQLANNPLSLTTAQCEFITQVQIHSLDDDVCN